MRSREGYCSAPFVRVEAILAVLGNLHGVAAVKGHFRYHIDGRNITLQVLDLLIIEEKFPPLRFSPPQFHEGLFIQLFPNTLAHGIRVCFLTQATVLPFLHVYNDNLHLAWPCCAKEL